jgi:hypothetical protein
MPQSVRRDFFGDPGPPHRHAQRSPAFGPFTRIFYFYISYF